MNPPGNLESWPTPQIFVAGSGGGPPANALTADDGATTLTADDGTTLLLSDT